jgi:hypothetical protein
MPVFKPEITLGTILEIFTLLGALLGMGIGIIRKFSVLETKLNIIFNWWTTNIAGGHSDTPHQSRERERFYGAKLPPDLLP